MGSCTSFSQKNNIKEVIKITSKTSFTDNMCKLIECLNDDIHQCLLISNDQYLLIDFITVRFLIKYDAVLNTFKHIFDVKCKTDAYLDFRFEKNMEQILKLSFQKDVKTPLINWYKQCNTIKYSSNLYSWQKKINYTIDDNN